VSREQRRNENRLTMLLQLFNCFLVRPNDGEPTNCLTSLWIDTLTGKIIHVGEFERQSADLDCFGLTEPILQEGEILAASKIDLNGQILSPGLIDIQINGSFDVDHSNWKGNEPQYRRGIQITSKNLPQTGVTAYIPTIISQSPAVYHKVLPLITDVARIHAMQRDQRACCVAAQSGAQVLGFHAEGPFLSSEKIGCHPKANVITAEEGWKAFEDVYGEASLKRDQSVRPSVKLITMAPELPGVMDCIARLVDAGFVISIGHSYVLNRSTEVIPY
jgi:N-acetylglucosamine-6-phosphate deacetylase